MYLSEFCFNWVVPWFSCIRFFRQFENIIFCIVKPKGQFLTSRHIFIQSKLSRINDSHRSVCVKITRNKNNLWNTEFLLSDFGFNFKSNNLRFGYVDLQCWTRCSTMLNSLFLIWFFSYSYRLEIFHSQNDVNLRLGEKKIGKSRRYI